MRVLAVLPVLLAVGGCAAGIPGYAQVEGASVIATDKTLVDNIVSYYTKKDCSTLRKQQGLTYCEEDEIIPRPNIYCYRTLGQVTCYDREAPFDPRAEKVGQNDHNYVRDY